MRIFVIILSLIFMFHVAAPSQLDNLSKFRALVALESGDISPQIQCLDTENLNLILPKDKFTDQVWIKFYQDPNIPNQNPTVYVRLTGYTHDQTIIGTELISIRNSDRMQAVLFPPNWVTKRPWSIQIEYVPSVLTDQGCIGKISLTPT